jgi:hypothetical protein
MKSPARSVGQPSARTGIKKPAALPVLNHVVIGLFFLEAEHDGNAALVCLVGHSFPGRDF